MTLEQFKNRIEHEMTYDVPEVALVVNLYRKYFNVNHPDNFEAIKAVQEYQQWVEEKEEALNLAQWEEEEEKLRAEAIEEEWRKDDELSAMEEMI